MPKVIIAVLAMLVTLNVVLTVILLDEHDQWDPLGDYPLQRILDVNEKTVTVEGTKCNDEDKPVVIRGTVSWQRVVPRGFVHETGEGTGIRNPGCETLVFENPIPAEVLAKDAPGIVWKITGEETPIRSDEVGVTVTYESETFEIPPFGPRGGLPR